MAADWRITGGAVLGEGGLGRATLHVAGGRIADAAPGARTFDAAGLVVAPGIVDVHGDGVERALMPRVGVAFAPETALVEIDRQLAANGITTAYLAVTASWEPGLRSPEAAGRLIGALARLRPSLGTDIRIQIRWEVFAVDAVEAVEGWLAAEPAPVLALNDHLTPLLTGDRLARKLPDLAARAGLAVEDYRALVTETARRHGEVAPAIARLAAAARRRGAVLFAHDEESPGERARNRRLGARVSEFPRSRATARAAVEAGEPVILGAPNLLRGGSHSGAIDAAEAVRDGHCAALASDYYYPALARAAWMLGPEAGWPLVSSGAAGAVGLTDRGRLAPGLRADLALLAETPDGPVVEAAFVAGRPVFLRDAARIGAPVPVTA